MRVVSRDELFHPGYFNELAKGGNAFFIGQLPVDIETPGRICGGARDLFNAFLFHGQPRALHEVLFVASGTTGSL